MKAFTDFLAVFHGAAPQTSRSGSPWNHLPGTAKPAAAYTHFSHPSASRLLQEKTAGDWHVWLLGELYSYRNTRLKEGAAPLFAQVCQDLAASGDVHPSINGHFLLIAQHMRSHDWHVWTSRFGTFHGYYAQQGKTACFGTFFQAVAEAASARQWDWEALAGYCSFGFFPQNRTFYEDVRILTEKGA
jgi:hypothetical protein